MLKFAQTSSSVRTVDMSVQTDDILNKNREPRKTFTQHQNACSCSGEQGDESSDLDSALARMGEHLRSILSAGDDRWTTGGAQQLGLGANPVLTRCNTDNLEIPKEVPRAMLVITPSAAQSYADVTRDCTMPIRDLRRTGYRRDARRAPCCPK